MSRWGIYKIEKLGGDLLMKKLSMLAMLLGLGLFTVGCGDTAAPVQEAPASPAAEAEDHAHDADDHAHEAGEHAEDAVDDAGAAVEEAADAAGETVEEAGDEVKEAVEN